MEQPRGDTTDSRMLPATSSPRLTRESAEHRERVRLFSKLFAIYPQAAGETSELKLRAYLDETMDIEPVWLSRALARLVRQEREFAPSLAEVRAEACRQIDDAKPRQEQSASREERQTGAVRLQSLIDRLMARKRMP